jgi:dipeptidyl aminopeptidase/acylaminoacyl peptidase
VRWVGTALDRNLAPFGGARTPVWDGDDVLVPADDRGNVHLYRISATDAAAPAVVVGGERCVTDFDVAGATLAFAATTIGRPAEIFAVIGGAEQQRSSVTDAFVTQAQPLPAYRFTAPSTGGAEVDVWVFLPPGFDPARRYPALLNIHGGPFTQYGNRFFDEVQVQASAGYVVVMANPRGSSGREEAWARAIVGPKARHDPGTSWGSVDYDDVMAAMDEALRRYPAIDPARLGVLGGSYGGYMTTWVVAHTNRFAAACSERAVNDMIIEESAADIASGFRFNFGPAWFEDPEEYRRISPITYVRDIDTPLLILHSEDDLRCPIAGAEQLFVALRLMGKEVEFYRFPAEGHELSRSGSPVHRIQRAELILDWFERHLGMNRSDR